MHPKGINGQTPSEFLEKLTTDGFAGASRAHTQVTKATWSGREKDMARRAIAEHYGAGNVRPPPPMPIAKAPVGRASGASQWARSFVDAKPKTPAKAPPKPAPKAPAKPTPKQAPPKKKTRAVMTPEERLEKHRAYNREYARRRKAEADAALAAARGAVQPTDPTPFSVQHEGESVPATVAAMAHATRHELANLEMRVAILEEMPAAKRGAVDPIEVMRSLQSAMLAMGDATKTDAALMPELHRIGRSLARVCVHVAEAVAGPEHPPTRGRGRPPKLVPDVGTPPPEETLPAEETVSLPFDIDEGPESMAAE